MKEREADRKIGVLKAVIQMALPQLYWDDEKDPHAFFRETGKRRGSARDHDSERADRGGDRSRIQMGREPHAHRGQRARNTPVARFLDPEQRERVRFGLVAMDAADTAFRWAMEAPAPKGNKRRIANRRIGLAEEVFVTEILNGLCEQEVDIDPNKPPREWLEQLPENWRAGATRELDRVLERVAEAVGKKRQ